MHVPKAMTGSTTQWRRWNASSLVDPPHPGWWQADMDKKKTLWRWWDGHRWSEAFHCWSHIFKMKCDPSTIPKEKHTFESAFLFTSAYIYWNDYWPAKAPHPNHCWDGPIGSPEVIPEVVVVTEPEPIQVQPYVTFRLPAPVRYVWSIA